MIYREMVLIGVLSIGFLGGCLGAKPEDQLYVAFENAANQEKALFDNVKTFEQLETKEQELYNQIIQEGKEQNEGVIQKIEQAIATVNEREKLVKDEKDVLEKAQKETASVHSYIDKIEDKRLKNQAEKVEEVYKNRYEVFQKINNSYKEELIAEKELYEKLKGKETKLKEIGEKVKTINTLNEETLKEKEKFNQYTKEYNEGKLKFYEDAKIKIKEKK
ncbi:lipoprotein [Bacillus cereus VDM021]|nr:YkyA family protein [Bacillus cereus group sp. BfR-BA-01315]EOP60384.1 lipoprotein [Bacillus cereus VD136]EOP71153.1 lipoprotein [Bacillus cereus VDM006]EOQ05957.1 lipoprotein [Bacillus cereus VDM021]